jgi:hypothetical protein
VNTKQLEFSEDSALDLYYENNPLTAKIAIIGISKLRL